MRADTLPIVPIAAFLAAAGGYHILAPAHSEKLLSKVGPVRSVGAILGLLGAWCLLAPAFVTQLVGLLVFLSGSARLIAPDRMIKLNTWTSRHAHGAMMLLGAIGCLFLVLA